MQFRVRRQTLIGDICCADPYGDNWRWFSETSGVYALTHLNIVGSNKLSIIFI